MARTGCLVCFISTINVCSKKRRKEDYQDYASRGHITNLNQSIKKLLISMVTSHPTLFIVWSGDTTDINEKWFPQFKLVSKKPLPQER
jgi:hypothetical protein